jgi:thiol-disulfide isomerase/thioredoxin
MKKLILSGVIAILAVVSANAQTAVVGTKATELNYKDPSGKEIALSSLKGNIVLIDFWASRCGPCRRNNPSVVATYNKYLGKKFVKGVKGFTVYSVSLDQNADAWKQAIKQDGLVWPYHVSDLKGWNAEGAAKYGIRSIPQTVLVDETGYVIAVNPSHQLIEQILDKKLSTGQTPTKTKTTTTKKTKTTKTGK